MRASFRERAIMAGVLTGVWIVAGCELLSLFRAVVFWPLVIWWVVPVAIMTWKWRRWRPSMPQLPRDWVLVATIGATALVLAFIFIQAARTPPNNWDALSAHLPRQVYWLQQQHVGLFPSNDSRMVIMPPLAEYAGLHLMILSDGDRWLNLIQWLALTLTAVTGSVIARELGCNARLQALAALLVVTIPTAAMEAANTKNDVVTAFFLCAFGSYGLKAYNSGKFSALLIGSACGLLALSKGTGMMFGLPVAAWIGAACVRAMGLKRAVLWGTGVALTALVINAGHFIRLTAAFGSPVGPPAGQGALLLANTLHTPRAFVSNLLRNTAMHLATGHQKIDRATTRSVTALHETLGLDVNDPRTTFVATGPFAITANFSDEDRAKAPVHMIVGMVAFVLAVAAVFGRRDKWITAFLLTPFAGFAVFCFLVAWQEWHSRLHIPVLCLVAPPGVYVLRRASLPFGVGALALGLMCLITNVAKPLNHLRQARYRFKDAEMIMGLQEARRAASEYRPRVIGIVARANRCEYFLLSSLMKDEKTPPQFVKVNNAYPAIKSQLRDPDMVITWYRVPATTNAAFHSRYLLVSEQGPVSIFLPKEHRPASAPNGSAGTPRPNSQTK